jgi:uncharacterized protein (DUF1697 family)
MRYLALLRGINVGGKAMVPMARLKTVFEQSGYDDVATYINSGNVIFSSRAAATSLPARIEAAITAEFGLDVMVLVRTAAQMAALTERIPAAWVNDGSMRCDVMFLAPAIDAPSVLTQLPGNPEIEDLRYVAGAVLWRIDRVNAGRSRMTKIIGKPVYRQMTARNVNTVRTLTSMMNG